MLKHVRVSDKDGKVLMVYPIDLDDITGRTPTDFDFFDIATSNAVEDGLVAKDDVKGLKLEILP